MSMRPPLLALGVALATAGCAATAPALAPPAVGGVAVSAWLAPARSLLDVAPSTIVQPLTLANVDNAEVTLYRSTGDAVLATKRVEATAFEQRITFANLAASTAYRIEVKAWQEPARTTRVDNLDVDAASCTTSFTTGTGESQDIGTLKLKLAGTPFRGATPELPLVITEGPLADTRLRASFPEDLVR